MEFDLIFWAPIVWFLSVVVGNANLNPFYVPQKPLGCPFCLSVYLSVIFCGLYLFTQSEFTPILPLFVGLNPFIVAYLNHKINQWL